jgi:hypothetical protein
MKDIQLLVSADADISSENSNDRIYKRVNHTENEEEGANKNNFNNEINQMVLPSEQRGLNTNYSNNDTQNNDMTEGNLIIKKEKIRSGNYNNIPIPITQKSTLEKIKDKVSKIKSFDVRFKNKNSINFNTLLYIYF